MALQLADVASFIRRLALTSKTGSNNKASALTSAAEARVSQLSEGWSALGGTPLVALHVGTGRDTLGPMSKPANQTSAPVALLLDLQTAYIYTCFLASIIRAASNLD